ncbi:MAG: 30S ribosomal protein S20 [Deltaproteobacteria bacterium]|nr:30S ribosomal protein S20 [Deltaproteobacteria bacterium]
MAVHASVIKRHRQSLKRRAKNQEVKSRIRTLIKKVKRAIEVQDRDSASVQLKEVNRTLRKAVSKGVFKHNTASRWLSRLARSVHLTAPRSEAPLN